MDWCKNNAEKSSATKLSDHIPSGISMPKISSFKDIKSKYDEYIGKDCIKKVLWMLKNTAKILIIIFFFFLNEVINIFINP